jgi:hypothetical protein
VLDTLSSEVEMLWTKLKGEGFWLESQEESDGKIGERNVFFFARIFPRFVLVDEEILSQNRLSLQMNSP